MINLRVYPVDRRTGLPVEEVLCLLLSFGDHLAKLILSWGWCLRRKGGCRRLWTLRRGLQGILCVPRHAKGISWYNSEPGLGRRDWVEDGRFSTKSLPTSRSPELPPPACWKLRMSDLRGGELYTGKVRNPAHTLKNGDLQVFKVKRRKWKLRNYIPCLPLL